MMFLLKFDENITESIDTNETHWQHSTNDEVEPNTKTGILSWIEPIKVLRRLPTENHES